MYVNLLPLPVNSTIIESIKVQVHVLGLTVSIAKTKHMHGFRKKVVDSDC